MTEYIARECKARIPFCEQDFPHWHVYEREGPNTAFGPPLLLAYSEKMAVRAATALKHAALAHEMDDWIDDFGASWVWDTMSHSETLFMDDGIRSWRARLAGEEA